MLLRTLLMLSLLATIAWMHPVRAAESYTTCTNAVTTVPRTIGTAGIWCLKANLATSNASVKAITIAADGVTIDCNNFEINESAGAANKAIAIYLQDHFNSTIRNCNIQGFEHGIYLAATTGSSGGGHLVESNHIEGNMVTGIRVEGDGSIVRGNLVFDTGGSTLSGITSTYGIFTNWSVGVSDNTVMGVLGHVGANGNAFGIFATGASSGTIEGNRLRGIVSDGTGKAMGIRDVATGRSAVRDNAVFGNGSAGSIGVYCASSTVRAKDNTLDGFATGWQGCGNAGDNDTSP